MKIFVIKKEKGKKYDSKSICKNTLSFDLEYDGEKPIGASISDTKNYWACCIGQCGIDIEEKGRIVKPNIIRSLHPLEQEYLSALSFGSSEWNTEFFHIWTAKEAVYKLTGYSFKQISVLDDDMTYKAEIEGYKLLFSEEKGLYLSLISGDDNFEIEYIKYAGVSAKKCIDYAAELLAIKPYSSADLLKKLKTKGYTESESQECIEKLKELSYLDDAEYARRFTENAVLNGKGASYIKSKLLQSGISADYIPEINKDDQFEAAMEIARSLYEETTDYEQKQKLLAKIGRRLASRGFEPEVVYKVLGKLK